MNTIMLEDLQNHPDKKYAYELVRYIGRKIKGRFCINESIHYLWLLRDLYPDRDITENTVLDAIFDDTVYVEIGVLYGGSMTFMLSHPSCTSGIGIDLGTYYGQQMDPDCEEPINSRTIYNNVLSFIEFGNKRSKTTDEAMSTILTCGR